MTRIFSKTREKICAQGYSSKSCVSNGSEAMRKEMGVECEREFLKESGIYSCNLPLVLITVGICFKSSAWGHSNS